MKKLAGQARKADLLYERQPSNSGRKEWREFCELAELIPETIGSDGSFHPHTSESKIAACLTMWATFLIYEKEAPQSSIMGRYSEGLRLSKLKGVWAVKGSKEALRRVYAHKDQHIPGKKPPVLTEQKLGRFLRELTNHVFGQPGKRTRRSELVKSEVSFYFYAIVGMTLAIRGASLAPSLATGRKGNDFILSRDLLFDTASKTVVIGSIGKPSRAKRRAQVDDRTYPKLPRVEGVCPIFGPYRVTRILRKILSAEEQSEYLVKKVQTRRGCSAITRREVTEWLRKLEKLPNFSAILAGSKVRLDSSTLRKQGMTLFQKLAKNPAELRKLSGHASIKTTLRHYVSVPKEREIDMRGGILTGLSTGGMESINCQKST